jgi:2-hydroxy-6-oxonona-2,4-dienedioate hydrolase
MAAGEVNVRRTPTIWQDLMGVPLSQEFLNVKGVRTRILRAGNPDAPPLLLLHGTTGHVETYARNIRAHVEHFHVIAMDMLGHGFTDKPEARYEIEDYARHVGDTMDALALDAVLLSGQSLGGWVAARFTLDAPHRVQRLCLNTTGGAHSDPGAMKSIREKTLAAAENPTSETVRKRLEFLMAHPERVTDELVESRRAVYLTPGMVEATRRILCLQDPEIRARNLLPDDDWRRIAVPTLVLWTTHDPTAPVEVGRRIASCIPCSQFALMEDCGHWPQWERPEVFDRLHIAFMLGKEGASQ